MRIHGERSRGDAEGVDAGVDAMVRDEARVRLEASRKKAANEAAIAEAEFGGCGWCGERTILVCFKWQGSDVLVFSRSELWSVQGGIASVVKL